MSENTRTQNDVVDTETVETETVVEETALPSLTPFFAARVVNAILSAAGIDKTITPQMMYTYAKKGYIESNYDTRSNGEKIRFDGAALKAWIDQYVTRLQNGEEAGGQSVETLVALFS